MDKMMAKCDTGDCKTEYTACADVASEVCTKSVDAYNVVLEIYEYNVAPKDYNDCVATA